jgi:hypothetical protein
MSIELFRYRGGAKDGGTLECVFEAGDQYSPNAVTKEKAAENRCRFYDDLLPRTSRVRWRLRNLGRSRYRSGSSAFRTRSKDQDPVDQKVRGLRELFDHPDRTY